MQEYSYHWILKYLRNLASKYINTAALAESTSGESSTPHTFIDMITARFTLKLFFKKIAKKVNIPNN